MRLTDFDSQLAKLARVALILAGLLLCTRSEAQTCLLPAGTQAAAAKVNWSFSPPVTCPDGPIDEYAAAPAPIVSPTARIDGTGTAPIKVPYLRHPAGGDPVLGDGEFFEARTDVELAGYGVHYEFTRTYRSRVNYAGVLGYGWDHNYNQRIIGVIQPGGWIESACDNSIEFQDGSLNRVHFSYAYTSDNNGTNSNVERSRNRCQISLSRNAITNRIICEY